MNRMIGRQQVMRLTRRGATLKPVTCCRAASAAGIRMRH